MSPYQMWAVEASDKKGRYIRVFEGHEAALKFLDQCRKSGMKAACWEL